MYLSPLLVGKSALVTIQILNIVVQFSFVLTISNKILHRTYIVKFVTRTHHLIDLCYLIISNFNCPVIWQCRAFVLRPLKVLRIGAELCRDERNWLSYLTPRGRAYRKYFQNACVNGWIVFEGRWVYVARSRLMQQSGIISLKRQICYIYLSSGLNRC